MILPDGRMRELVRSKCVLKYTVVKGGIQLEDNNINLRAIRKE
jgi:hypothetical protein